MEPKNLNSLPTWVEVDLDTLLANLAAIKHEVGEHVKIQLTIKADAYGHGAVHVARATSDVVARFGVATVDEAVELAEAGVANPVLILSPILPTEADVIVEHGFAITASTPEFVEFVSDRAHGAGKCVEVHVEVDTGMGRTGVFEREVAPLLGRIAALPGVCLGGLFSHFPVSDEDEAFTREQIHEFAALLVSLRARGIEVPIVHCANSGAILKIQESHFHMVRPGLVAYGHVPGGGNQRWRVRPIMTWKTRVVQIRDVPKGSTISYGRTFTVQRDSVIGVLPVGYGHGYPFRLSGRGAVLMGGERVAIVGRVTMDMTMVDLTDLARRPRVGDEAVLVGAQGDQEITVDDLADWAGTLSYEILCGVSKRVPRIYRRAGRIESVKSLLGVVADVDQPI